MHFFCCSVVFFLNFFSLRRISGIVLFKFFSFSFISISLHCYCSLSCACHVFNRQRRSIQLQYKLWPYYLYICSVSLDFNAFFAQFFFASLAVEPLLWFEQIFVVYFGFYLIYFLCDLVAFISQYFLIPPLQSAEHSGMKFTYAFILWSKCLGFQSWPKIQMKDSEPKRINKSEYCP